MEFCFGSSSYKYHRIRNFCKRNNSGHFFNLIPENKDGNRWVFFFLKMSIFISKTIKSKTKQNENDFK